MIANLWRKKPPSTGHKAGLFANNDMDSVRIFFEEGIYRCPDVAKSMSSGCGYGEMMLPMGDREPFPITVFGTNTSVLIYHKEELIAIFRKI